MRKILSTIFILCLLTSNVYGADEWSVDAPLGSASPSTLDTLIGTNNEALDRLMSNYRNGGYGYFASSATFGVSVGEVVCSNAGGTVRRFRQNTSATTVTWTDIDTGSEANSTVYYYYAVGDADATTFTIKASTSSVAPSGATYYKKLGSFYNNSSGNIEFGGIIAMFSGATTTIPDGWILCNGSNGTPDLRDRFIIGAGTSADPGDYNTLTSVSGTGSTIINSSGSNDKQGGSGTCTGANRNMMPPYYALCFVQKRGVE